jgi:hypothetical protein
MRIIPIAVLYGLKRLYKPFQLDLFKRRYIRLQMCAIMCAMNTFLLVLNEAGP